MPKKSTLFALFLTALFCSRVMFYFFNDPEGPNLLVVTVAALVIYFPSLLPYVFKTELNHRSKALLAIIIQGTVASLLLYFM